MKQDNSLSSSRRIGRRQSTVARTYLLMTVPALAVYVFVVLVPSLQGIGYAFTDWDGLSQDVNFVGFDNIVAVFTREASSRALINTLVIAVAYTIVANVIGLGLAVLLNTKIKSRSILKSVFFLPAILTSLVVAYLWKFMLSPQGPVNAALESVGLGALAQPWLGEPTWALVSIIVVLVWQFLGYTMLIYLAGLQGIPEETLEASKVDGAGPWRTFWSITLPLLGPAITINFMLTMLGGLKLFDQVFALTAGGPGGSTHTLSTLLYLDAFLNGKMGRGVAMALVLTVRVTIIALVQYRLLSKREVRS